MRPTTQSLLLASTLPRQLEQALVWKQFSYVAQPSPPFFSVPLLPPSSPTRSCRVALAGHDYPLTQRPDSVIYPPAFLETRQIPAEFALGVFIRTRSRFEHRGAPGPGAGGAGGHGEAWLAKVGLLTILLCPPSRIRRLPPPTAPGFSSGRPSAGVSSPPWGSVGAGASVAEGEWDPGRGPLPSFLRGKVRGAETAGGRGGQTWEAAGGSSSGDGFTRLDRLSIDAGGMLAARWRHAGGTVHLECSRLYFVWLWTNGDLHCPVATRISAPTGTMPCRPSGW